MHETLVSKGFASKGFPSVVSQVATLRHGVLVSDPGRTKFIINLVFAYISAQ